MSDMIKGIGTDIIDIPRVTRLLEKDDGFKNKIFAVEEIEYSEPKASKSMNYAARFAAKEAFFKAMGTGWRYGMKWTDVVVLNNEEGKPDLELRGKALELFREKGFIKVNLSLSHTKEYAVAFVIIE